MDPTDINIINKYKDLIVKDLHGDVFLDLRDRGVLTEEDCNKINLSKETSQEEKNNIFLDILVSKKNGFKPFIKSLEDWYEWIASKLKEQQPASWSDAIAYCKIPSLPPRNVSRSALLESVRSELKGLRKGYYVVIYGMSGCGKSTLAAEALHDNILVEQFEGKVFWLSCRKEETDISLKKEVADEVDKNDIFCLQDQLNTWICDEELVSDDKPANTRSLNTKIMKRFKNSECKEGLVVLDDVNSAQVIEALNIGCKTLVTTNNLDIMKQIGIRYKGIKVSEGFTEEESLQYFSQCLEMEVNKLPEQAKKIHNHGKGHPLMLSLIGAQLEAHKEEVQTNPESWDPYLKVLENKEYGNLRKRHSYGGMLSMRNTIQMCINSLSEDLREKYQDFALFVEDVNIKEEVLQILWKSEQLEVRSILDEFCNKSLIVRKYNKKFFVYGIHDLLLYHLKKGLNEDNLKDLHTKLLERYEEECGGNLPQLKSDDNYFFYYIGYHIANAKKYAMFHKWYFNLDFIEAKIKAAGPRDLLLDYKRYSSHFTEGCFDKGGMVKKLADFVHFVETVGLLVNRKDCNIDIVQLALQEPHESDVYLTAVAAIKQRPNNTYLYFKLGPSPSRSAPHMIQTREKVSSACFSTNSNYIIVGFESGTIQIINQKGYSIREYSGHSKRVNRLEVSAVTNILLSISENCLKIWLLPEMNTNILNGDGSRTPSPSQRQPDFTDIFSPKSPDKKSCWITFSRNFAISWACISTNGKMIATCCPMEDIIKINAIKAESLLLDINRTSGTTCIFSSDDEQLIIGCSNSKIIVHSIAKNSRLIVLINSYPILALFTLPGNNGELEFGALTRATLCVWSTDGSCFSADKSNNKYCLRDYNRGESEEYMSCAAAQDGSVVAVATSSRKVIICRLSDGFMVRHLQESSGHIKCLAVDNSPAHMLIGCYDDTTIRLWTLGEIHSGQPTMMKRNFVVAWNKNSPILAAPCYQPCVKKIIEGGQEEDLIIPENCEVNVSGISTCGKYIVAGTSHKSIYLHVSSDCESEVMKINNESGMVKILTVEKNIVKVKVEVSEQSVFVVVGLDRSVNVWSCNEKDIVQENDISKSQKPVKHSIQLSDRIVDYYIRPVEKELIIVSQNGGIKKWNLLTGKMKEVLVQARLDVTIGDASFGCTEVALTLDFKRLLLNIYDLRTKSEKQLKLPTTPTCCSFSVDGQQFAIGFQNGDIQVRELAEPEGVRAAQTMAGRPVVSVCVSRAGLIGAALDGQVWLVPAGVVPGRAKLQVARLVMAPDDRTVVTVDDHGHMHLIDLFDKDRIRVPFGSSNNTLTNFSMKGRVPNAARKTKERNEDQS